MRPQKRSETITLNIPITSTQTKFNFPDIPQLRSDNTKDIAIRQLETYYINILPVDFNNVPLPTVAQLNAAFLTLFIEGEEAIFRYPLISLVAVSNATAGQVSSFELDEYDDLQVDWTKSYISTPVALNNVAAFSYVIRVSYKRYPPGYLQQKRLAIRNNPTLQNFGQEMGL